MFTDDEKNLVFQIIQQKNHTKSFLFDYAVYVMPSILFAGYGLWREDFAAILVAYVVLLLMVIIYLNHAHSYSKSLRSALIKYEEKLKVLLVENSSKT